MKKCLFHFVLLSALTIGITSCQTDNDAEGRQVEDVSKVNVTYDGVYIVNEGSYYAKLNGSLTFINTKTNKVMQNWFQNVNGRSLGGTPNDALIDEQGRMYIASTDEGRVEITNATTMKSVGFVKIPHPRHLAENKTSVFVSSYSGRVYKLDKKTAQVVDSSAVIGANLEGIAVKDENVYVCNSWNPDFTYNNNVVKLTTDLKKVKDITVALNPNQLMVYQNKMYVFSIGNYQDVPSEVQALDLKTGQLTTITKNVYKMALGKDKLYFIRNIDKKYKYSYLDLKTNQEVNWTEGQEVESPYAMAIEPNSGAVFITSLKINPDTHYPDYNSDGYVVKYNTNGQFEVKSPCGVNPGTIVFPQPAH